MSLYVGYLSKYCIYVMSDVTKVGFRSCHRYKMSTHYSCRVSGNGIKLKIIRNKPGVVHTNVLHILFHILCICYC